MDLARVVGSDAAGIVPSVHRPRGVRPRRGGLQVEIDAIPAEDRRQADRKGADVSEDGDIQEAGERREYFRIGDRVLLKVRPVDAGEVDAVVERITDRVPDRFTVAANFAVNSRATARLLHGVAADAPDAARYMKALDAKLNHLARLFVLEEVEAGGFPRLDVTLSAGGVIFPSAREFAPGTLLETRLVLYPHMTGVLTVSEVVRCGRHDGGPADMPWRVAVEYVHIRESDRDLLVSHIMARETELLRRQRGEDDA